MNWFRIIGFLAALWGAGILASAFLRAEPIGSSAYGAGRITGLVFGVVLLGVGLYAAITGGKKKNAS